MLESATQGIYMFYNSFGGVADCVEIKLSWRVLNHDLTPSTRRHLDGVSTRRAGCLPHRSIHASLDGVNNHNVMLFDLNSCALENFECHYNKYCAQQDLKPFLKEELQAELASRFDCKFKRVRISA